jgi:hypothetical protein
MTLNSSGPISLGGATTGQSINLEIGAAATTQVSLNDTNVRLLAQVPTGAIQMPTNFWGKKFSANSATFFMMGGGGVYGSIGAAPGGGGQMIGQTGQTVSVTGTTYSIVVGAAGSNSTAFGYTAIAGGNGGGASGSGAGNCISAGGGACGGAGAFTLCPAGTCAAGTGIYSNGGTSQVYLQNTGSGCAAWSATGGSGGLGGSGTNGTITGNPYSGGTLRGGNGGAPAYASFNATSTSIAYGGGLGGGACWVSDGSSATCINGSTTGTPAVNTGYGNYSGVVIIRVSNAFPQPASTGSPTIVNSGGYYWFTFTGSGTITF